MIFWRSTSVLFLLIGYSFISLIVMAQRSPNPHPNTRPPAAKDKVAKKLFKQSCVKCHGADGAGETTQGQILGATDFTDSEWQERVDDERLDNSITYGRGQMPAFGEKLTREQITLLLTYVRSFKK
jgi:mono/diheme cytochrome c family protein